MGILLTGGTGVVGTRTIEALNHHQVITVSRRVDAGSSAIRGDVTQPGLGLSDDETERLRSDGVEMIIHIAGEVSFNRTRDQYRRTNVDGTRNVADLARRLQARLIYVSTAYAERAESPTFIEKSAGPSAYAASKLEAENIVRESGLAHVLIRPSIVIGDSRTGQIGAHQGIHAFARNLLLDRLPFLPVQPDWILDMMPVDLLATIIARVVDDWPEGRTIWATSGRDSLTAREVVLSCRGDGPIPRFIDPTMYDRLIRPAFVDDMPADVVRRIETLVHTCDQLFSEDVGFPSSVGEICGARDWPRFYAEAWKLNVEALGATVKETA